MRSSGQSRKEQYDCEPVGIGGADDLGRDFGKDQDDEGDEQGAGSQRPLVLAEQFDGDDRDQRRRGGVDQIVAEQDDAQHLVGRAEQFKGQSGAAMSLAGQVAQP